MKQASRIFRINKDVNILGKYFHQEVEQAIRPILTYIITDEKKPIL
jgi:hypothetical protein